MNVFHSLKKGLRALHSSRIPALIAALTVIVTSTVSTEHAAALYILNGSDRSAVKLESFSSATERGFTMIDLATGKEASTLSLTPNQPVTIYRDEEVLTAKTQRETVIALLGRMGIRPSPLEMVTVDTSGGHVEIRIGEEIIYYDRVSEVTAYETQRIPNPALAEGTEVVVRAGQNGVCSSIYEVVLSHGEEISRQLVEQTDSTAVSEIIEYGTATGIQEPVSHVETHPDGSGTVHFVSGNTVNFTSTKDMTATAYTAGHGGAGYITALGTDLHVGVVAVDKKVIPLRTKVLVVTDSGIVYGPAVAEDTGVRGDVIDLYMDSYQECMEFGRRGCTVYILE